VDQVLRQEAQALDQEAQVSDQEAQVSDQEAQVSDQEAQVLDQGAQASHQDHSWDQDVNTEMPIAGAFSPCFFSSTYKYDMLVSSECLSHFKKYFLLEENVHNENSDHIRI
jgi:hypothetical protein